MAFLVDQAVTMSFRGASTSLDGQVIKVVKQVELCLMQRVTSRADNASSVLAGAEC